MKWANLVVKTVRTENIRIKKELHDFYPMLTVMVVVNRVQKVLNRLPVNLVARHAVQADLNLRLGSLPVSFAVRVNTRTRQVNMTNVSGVQPAITRLKQVHPVVSIVKTGVSP